MQTKTYRRYLASSAATVAGLTLAFSAFASDCDEVTQILVADHVENNVSRIDFAAMNSDGTVVISITDDDGNHTRILTWSTVDPGADPTESPLVASDGRGSPFSFALDATINEDGAIIFVGKEGRNSVNVYSIDELGSVDGPLLSFATMPAPISISQLVLLEALGDDDALTFVYWQLRDVSGTPEHCVNHSEGDFSHCAPQGGAFISPAANNNGDVFFLRINPDGTSQIVSEDDPNDPICTVQSGALLSSPSVNENGIVTFYASQDCGGTGAPGRGIYWYDGVTLEFLDFDGHDLEAPAGQDPRPHINDENRIAFVAWAPAESEFGIYTFDTDNPGPTLVRVNDDADVSVVRTIFGYMVEPTDPNGDTDRILYRGVNDDGKEALFLATTCQTGSDCPADLNNDGEVDALDLLILLGLWGPCPGCDADLNGDDEVDALDLLILLGAWGSCP